MLTQAKPETPGTVYCVCGQGTRIKAWSFQSGCISQSGAAVAVAGASCSISAVTLKPTKVALYNYCVPMIKWEQRNVLINSLITPSTKSNYQAVRRSLERTSIKLEAVTAAHCQSVHHHWQMDGQTDESIGSPTLWSARRFTCQWAGNAERTLARANGEKKRETHPSETDVASLSHISDLVTAGGSECCHCFC